MFNGLLGNMFDNNNWWLWAAALIILLNPELRGKLFGREKEAVKEKEQEIAEADRII